MRSIEVKSGNRFWKAMLGVLLLLLLVSATVSRCAAQTFGEWFRQKKTQEKYLLEQLAGLRLYMDYARDGYRLVDGGLQTIKQLSSGEFRLHEAFVSGLKKVSPAISQDVRVLEIVALQWSILQQWNRIRSSAKGHSPAEQLVYFSSVADAVLGEAAADLEALLLVLSPGKLELEDAARLARLGEIHERMLDKYRFSKDFGTQVQGLIGARQQELNHVNWIRRYYELD